MPATTTPESGAPTPRPAFSPLRSAAAGGVAVAFLVVVFATVLPRVGDYSGAWEAVGDMDAAGVAGLVAAVAVYLVAYGAPFAAATPGLRYWPAFSVNQAAFAVSNGVPAGAPLGLALQLAMLTSYGATPAAATAAISTVAVWSLLVTLVMPVLGVLALLVGGDDGSSYVLPALLGLGAVVVVVGGFALVLRSDALARRLGGWGDRLAGPVVRRVRPTARPDLAGALSALRAGLVDLVARRWHVITASQLLVGLTQFAVLFVALRAVAGPDGSPLPLAAAFGGFAISQLGLLVPLTPGGLGTVDAAMVGLLVTLGADAGEATAGALVWRASSYLPQIVVGLVSIAAWRVHHRSSRAGTAALPGTATQHPAAPGPAAPEEAP